jgi:hypothetical protein
MRRPVRALFENPRDARAEEVAKSEILKDLLKTHVPLAIENALVKKKIYASIFEINDSKQFIEIHKNNWVQALETCLIWYVEDEDYEVCNHIKNLIFSIQDKVKVNKISIQKPKSNGQ